MLKVEPGTISTPELHGFLLGAVAPRPIALASTLAENGNPNLSPFSFFNVFSANPPIAIFSPARRGRDNTTKHTYENVKKNSEVVINVVNYDLVQQTSLSSTEYADGVNEFTKAGLTAISSEKVAPYRVKESPVQLECKVREVVELGNEGGAGNLVICEIVLMHIDENILGEDGKIDQQKIDLVGRLGKNWYVRASGESLFEVEKPLRTLGVGVDAIPQHIQSSFILSGNDLGKLGNVDSIPEPLDDLTGHPEIQHIFRMHADAMERREALHQYAKELLEKDQVINAWNVLLSDKLNRI